MRKNKDRFTGNNPIRRTGNHASFDKAHREDHARTVISRSLALAAHFQNLDIDMVYLAAAFHDLGLANGHENHHHDSPYHTGSRCLHTVTFHHRRDNNYG